MRRFFKYLTVFFSFIDISVYAQSGLCNLTINVKDEASSAAIENAIIIITGTQNKTASAVTGSITLNSLPSGLYTVAVRGKGYQEKSEKITLDTAMKKDYTVTFNLKKLSIPSPTAAPLPSANTPPVKAAASPSLLNVSPVKETPTQKTVQAMNVSPVKETPTQKTVQAMREPIAATAAIPAEIKKTGISKILLLVIIIVKLFIILAVIAGIILIIRSGIRSGLKPILVICVAGCGTLTLILIGIAIAVYYFSFSEKEAGAEQKEPLKTEASKTIDTTNKKKEPEINQDMFFDDACNKHDMGVMLFVNAVKSNNKEELEKGIALLEEAFRAEPDNQLYIVDLADAYVKMNNLLYMKLALDLYLGVLENNPENDRLLSRIADAYARIYRYDKAFQYASMRGWSKKTSPVSTASQISLICLLSGDFDRGILELKKLLRGDPPETPELKLILASLYAENEKMDIAAEIAAEVTASLPENSELYAKAQEAERSYRK